MHLHVCVFTCSYICVCAGMPSWSCVYVFMQMFYCVQKCAYLHTLMFIHVCVLHVGTGLCVCVYMCLLCAIMYAHVSLYMLVHCAHVFTYMFWMEHVCIRIAHVCVHVSLYVCVCARARMGSFIFPPLAYTFPTVAEF